MVLHRASSPEVRAAVVELVRGRLGCGCPDEVFDDIEWLEAEDVLLGVPGARLAFVTGRRLLVLVFDPRGLEEHMAGLVSAASSFVRARGLNRARLVVVLEDADSADRLRRAFDLTSPPEDFFWHRLSAGELPEALTR